MAAKMITRLICVRPLWWLMDEILACSESSPTREKADGLDEAQPIKKPHSLIMVNTKPQAKRTGAIQT